MPVPVVHPAASKGALPAPIRTGHRKLLQRCACGGKAGPTGACAECRKKKRLQPRLRIGAVGDRFEQEADRAAEAAMGRGLMPRLTPVGRAAQRLQRAPCCCCADGIDIVDVTGNPFFREGGRVGHRFEVPIKTHLTEGDGPPTGASDCTLEWRERSNMTAPLIAETGTWIDVFPVARQYLKEHPEDQIPAVAAWDARTPACGASDTLTLKDDPFVDGERHTSATRTLDFDLVLRSGAGCGCEGAERHAYARQRLQFVGTRPFVQGISFTTLDAEPGWPPEAETEAAPAEGVLNRAAVQEGSAGTEAPAGVHAALAAPGSALDGVVRTQMEQHFGVDFGAVRIHTDAPAARSADAVRARAYTVGSDVVFAAGQYAPHTPAGRHLLAHELAHVVQQQGTVQRLQRTLGDGFDLTSPRFRGDETLEAVYDSERFLFMGHRGDAVRKVQEALMAAGFDLPLYGADGVFGPETHRAVKDFQRAAGFSEEAVDGIIGPQTMSTLDERFPTEDAAGAPDQCTGAIKTISVDFLRFRGSSGDPAGDLAFANEVFQPCCVQFEMGQNIRVADTLSNMMLRDEAHADQPSNIPQPGDTDLTHASCGAITNEEQRAFLFSAGLFSLTSRFRVLYVESMTPSLRGFSVFPLCATGPRAPLNEMAAVMNGAGRRTLAHEFAHILTNTFSQHDVVETNILHTTPGSVGPATDVAPVQCDLIYENA